MTREDKQAEFERRIKAMLDEGDNELDGHVMSRLTQARHAAIDSLDKRSRSYSTWAPAAVVAGASVFALILWLGQQSPGPEGQQVAVLEDLELMLSEEDLEFYEELEFYAWLDDTGDLG